uniref:NADH-ubiquinone oxidoreductase chain 6 n=2 Tax=Laminariales TaxID=2886 RepID=Q52YK3_9PHAE|nr:NADH dehydrogenase subunit 6 [Macrocystis integrifolia]AAW59508.1 NADH dehydrogenase subunit 6 [Alaria sp. LL01AP]WBP70244.1 NADH dehydrogenase subunit 6 [Macrocystis pyrifera]AAW59526.1 NADH dehydrogenase subunit 6 [Macrocystis integrifolia]AAW65056.1 NADH dehydrogenase subunit 6 [Macrocystis integrifolia]QBZ73714.1 NADH dehydrogenase subunit 6 [Macrocystis integrifolia]
MVDPIIFIIIATLGGTLGVKVTSTQNPVYSGLYLVLLFFLGSAISFLLGLEFMALLFLLVYAGAIAVLVLFVVMMLDVKAIESPWSAKKKRLLYLVFLIFVLFLISAIYSKNLQKLMNVLLVVYMSSLVSFSLVSYEEEIKNLFHPVIINKTVNDNLKRFQERSKRKRKGEPEPSIKESKKTFKDFMEERIEIWKHLCDSEGLTEFLQLMFHKESVEGLYGLNIMWFIEFDSSCALNDPSYILYSTHAILLIIAGVILLIAMVGAISLTLQKNCPESLYRQLGRESKNAVFFIKEKPLLIPNNTRNLEVLS